MRLSHLTSLLVAAATFASCTKQTNSSPASAPVAAYCPYVANPKTYTGGLTLTGHATYQFRQDGNGAIPDGVNTYKPTIDTSLTTATYTINVLGPAGTKTGTFTCTTSGSTCDVLHITTGLVNSLNTQLTTADGLKAHGMTAVDLYPRSGIDGSVAFTTTATANLTAVGPRPIRYAEVQITDGGGNIAQCAETDASGNFSTQVPNDGGTYYVNVFARSNNGSNTAYVMNNPNDNVPFKVSTSYVASGTPTVSLQALATGTLEGGAFNIMDQIANAQNYLRTTTANCGTSTSANYVAGCIPVTTIPLIYAYWTPGLTPDVYYGADDPLSFYLLGKNQLYIGGGKDGNTTTSDMDQFDNSVIVHEYGHFVEDKFGAPNSPGGSHSGNYAIDPRLAWGEGWANFFQSAVTGIPMYRDTYGTVTCGKANCSTGSLFTEPLEDGTPYDTFKTDNPTVLGEGNFHEFSISRVLWAILKAETRPFAELWTAMNGPTGMRVVADSYKTVGRLHVIHSGLTAGANVNSWSSQLTAEKQRPDFTDYATPVNITSSCTTPTSIPMNVKVFVQDDGSYAASDQYFNNDFYIYNHPGGSLPVNISWSGSGSVDLDLYIYGPGYTFGSGYLAIDRRDATGSSTGKATATSGTASVAPNLAAGIYIINVMAATVGMPYGANVNTAYTMTIANHAACPTSL